MDEDQMAKSILYQLTRIADALASISMIAETEREEWSGTAYEYEHPAHEPDETDA